MRTRHPAAIGIALAVAASVLAAVALFGPPSSAVLPAQAAGGYDWPQFGGNPQHSNNNTQETVITPANVGTLRLLFRLPLPGTADGSPVYLSGVTTPGGVRDLLFLLTTTGQIMALDAHTGATVWLRQYGPGTCQVNNGSLACYTTSSPAIDPNRQYVYAYGLDGYVHKFGVGDGTEITGAGWPALATRKPWDEKGSSALSVATAANGTSYLYVTHGGYPGDRGDYQGHVTAINLASGAQAVFNAACSNQAVHFVAAPATPDCAAVQTAIWARVGVVYDPDTNRIYMATGNGLYVPGNYEWGDSVFALNPDGTGLNGAPLDSYTPANYPYLNTADLDLGSTAPALLPAPVGSSVKRLGLQGGKDAVLRLLNLDNLSGQGGPGHTGGEVSTLALPQGGQVLTAPAVWVNPADGSAWAFVANGNGISGLAVGLNGATPVLQARWTLTTGAGGTSPVIANNVLYYVSASGLRALNPATGAQLWADGSVTVAHWESPIVANGVLYTPARGGYLNAYAPARAWLPLLFH